MLVGRPKYDVADPSRRLTMYQIVITEGAREEIERFLHSAHLVSTWPKLSRLLGRPYRNAWESRFPELRQAAEVAAPVLQTELRQARQAVEAKSPRHLLLPTERSALRCGMSAARLGLAGSSSPIP
jgi:hypothetical protein